MSCSCLIEHFIVWHPQMFYFGASLSVKHFILYIIQLKQVWDGTGSTQTTTSAPKYLAALLIVNWCILDVIQIKFVCQVGKVALGWLLMNSWFVPPTVINLSSQKWKWNVSEKYGCYHAATYLIVSFLNSEQKRRPTDPLGETCFTFSDILSLQFSTPATKFSFFWKFCQQLW